MVWYSHLLKNFPQFDVIHTVKALAFVNKEVIVSKAEVNVFLELSCFFHDSVDVGNLISGSSAYGEALYSQQKQDQELTVAQTMNSLLPKSDLN